MYSLVFILLALLGHAAAVVLSASQLEVCATDGDDGLTDCATRVSTAFSLGEGESTGEVSISAADHASMSVAAAQPVRFSCRQLGTAVAVRYTSHAAGAVFARHNERLGTSPPRDDECWLPSAASAPRECSCFGSGIDRSGNQCGVGTLLTRTYHCLSVNEGLDPASRMYLFHGADVAFEWAIQCDVTLPWDGGELPAIDAGQGEWDPPAAGAAEATAHVLLRHDAPAARIGSLFYARCYANQISGYESAIALLRSRLLLHPVRQAGASDPVFADPLAHSAVVPESLVSLTGAELGKLGQSARLFYTQPDFCGAPAGTGVPASGYQLIKESEERAQLDLSAPFLLRRVFGSAPMEPRADTAEEVAVLFRPQLAHEAQVVVQVSGEAARFSEVQCSGRLLAAQLDRALDSGSTEPATLRAVVGANCLEGFTSAFQVRIETGHCVVVAGSAAPRSCSASCAGGDVDIGAGALPDCLGTVSFPLASTCTVAAGAEGQSTATLVLLGATNAVEYDRLTVRVAYQTDLAGTRPVHGQEELPTTGDERDRDPRFELVLSLALGLVVLALAVAGVVQCARRRRCRSDLSASLSQLCSQMSRSVSSGSALGASRLGDSSIRLSPSTALP